MMNMATFDVCSNLQVIAGKMGILEGADSYGSVGGFYVDGEFMIGAKNRQFAYDDVYQSSLNVLLDQDCQTYVYAMDSDLPLLWEYDYGKGRFVIMNQTMTGKSAEVSCQQHIVCWMISVYIRLSMRRHFIWMISRLRFHQAMANISNRNMEWISVISIRMYGGKTYWTGKINMELCIPV